MNDNVVAMADYSVKIDGETFGLTQIPNPKSNLVEKQKQAILKDINLTELNNGLTRCGGLLYLAFNGVAGLGDLRARINKLQDDLVVQSGKTSLALDKFSRRTDEVLGTVKDVFTYLTEGTEEVAIELLKDTGNVAEAMAREALELAQGYDRLADETMLVSGATQVAQGKKDEEIQQFKQQQQELEAKIKRAKYLSDSLAESRKKLEKLYTEAKAKADQAAERGFAVQMVGAILGPIAQGLGSIGGAFVAAKTGGLAGGSVPPPAPKVDTSEEDAAKKKLADEKEKEQKAKDELKEAETEKKRAEEAKTKAVETETKKKTDATLAQDKVDKKPGDEELKKAAEKAKKEAETALGDKTKAMEALETAEKKLEEKKRTLEAIGKSIVSAQQAVETAAKNLQTVGAGLLDLAKSYEEEKKSYLNKILEYEKQGIEALADMAGYAVSASAITDRTSAARLSSESLLQAIKALNMVAQILRDTAKFWMQMKSACDELVKPDFLRKIELFSKQSLEKRMAEWKKEAFKQNGITLMAKWQALHIVCAEASQAVSATRKQVQANIISSPSPEESYKMMPELAQALSISVTRAKEEAEGKLGALEKAAQETEKVA